MKTEHVCGVCECAKDQKAEPREKWKTEERPRKRRGGEGKPRPGVGYKAGTWSFGAERKEQWIVADVRSLLVWGQ